MHAEKFYAARVRKVWFFANEQGLLYTHSWTNSFAWISLGKENEFIMFDDMHNIFNVAAGHA